VKLLIDTEYYLYVAASAAEYEFEWAPDDWTYVCRHGDARANLQEVIDGFRQVCPDHTPTLVFGDVFSFRYGVWPQYKANRKKRRRPAGYKALQEWVHNSAATRGWDVAKLSDVEGDDVLGILYEEGDVIVSVDKDLLTVPGLHLRDGEIKEVTRLQADLSFYRQVLTGDATDGYPGIPGVGPVAADKALLGCTDELTMWRQVLAQYEKKGFGYPYVISQARCARILRSGEYDHAKGIPILWNPPVT
jgi:DNA polymerase-1